MKILTVKNLLQAAYLSSVGVASIGKVFLDPADANRRCFIELIYDPGRQSSLDAHIMDYEKGTATVNVATYNKTVKFITTLTALRRMETIKQ